MPAGNMEWPLSLNLIYLLEVFHLPRISEVYLVKHSESFLVMLLVSHFVLKLFEKFQGLTCWSAIRDSWIDSVFWWITLSNFLWNSQIKTFLLLEIFFPGKPQSFYLQFKLNNSQLFSILFKPCIQILQTQCKQYKFTHVLAYVVYEINFYRCA